MLQQQHDATAAACRRRSACEVGDKVHGSVLRPLAVVNPLAVVQGQQQPLDNNSTTSTTVRTSRCCSSALKVGWLAAAAAAAVCGLYGRACSLPDRQQQAHGQVQQHGATTHGIALQAAAAMSKRLQSGDAAWLAGLVGDGQSWAYKTSSAARHT